MMLEAMVSLSILTIAIFGVLHHMQVLANHHQRLKDKVELSRMSYDLSMIDVQQITHKRGPITGEKDQQKILVTSNHQELEVILERYEITSP